MRKIILSLLAVVFAITVSIGDAEAARKKRKHSAKNKSVHHKVHKHRKHQHKRFIIADQQVTVIHLAQAPQCGFLIFKSDCNTNSYNNIRAGNEFVGKTAHNNRAELRDLMGVDPVRIAWCAAFVNSILKRNGYENSQSLTAISYVNYGKITHRPEPGDIVVFKRLGRGQVTGHVGFYVDTIEQDGVKYVLSLGGNQDHAVTINAYPLSKVVGFRKPVAEQNI